MDEFQEEFVEGLAEHNMVRVAEDEGDTWTLTSERPHPDEDKTVKVESPYYFNMTGFGYHEKVLEPMLGWLEATSEAERVAGLNTGGNSMASALGGYSVAKESSISVIPVRKSSGDDRYTGMKRLGLPDEVNIEDKEIEITDDVGTTGKSVEELHELLTENANAEVSSWNIAVDRMEGVSENAQSHGAELNALVTAEEALEVLYQNRTINGKQYEMAREYAGDPLRWNQQHGFIE